jgi:Ala-tRNA(Pro) deacylase
MPAKKLKAFLDENDVPYESVEHPTAYTAQEVAQAAHIRGHNLAKTVIVKSGDQFVMVVLPADRKVIILDLREITGLDNLTFATEDEFKALFPDCEIGAMPPFGNLYGMEVYAAPSLEEGDEIAFNAGTHREVIKMRYRDFERLVHPRVENFTT